MTADKWTDDDFLDRLRREGDDLADQARSGISSRRSSGRDARAPSAQDCAILSGSPPPEGGPNQKHMTQDTSRRALRPCPEEDGR